MKKPPELELYVRAADGDPLAQLELEQWHSHMGRRLRLARYWLMASILLLAAMITVSFADSAMDGVIMAFALWCYTMAVFVLGVLTERYRP